jgi:hypothetical protein
MGRIRTIKPDFFKSASIAQLQYRTRLTFQGLWTMADDEGRLRYDPRVIAGELWPQEDEVTWRQVDEDIRSLVAYGFVDDYDANGSSFIQVVNWGRHQRINRATPSKFPPPPGASREEDGRLSEDSLSELSTPSPVSNSGGEPSLAEGEREREEEGEGEVSPPPRKCPAHINDRTSPPCGACRDARLHRDDWDKAHPAPSLPAVYQEPTCSIHDGYPHPDSFIGCHKCQEEGR